MPTWRRSATDVRARGRRCRAPSMSTWPSTRVPGMMSFIRLSVRRNVLLPQPDGPMKAVTTLGADLERDVRAAPACRRRRSSAPRRRSSAATGCVVVPGRGARHEAWPASRWAARWVRRRSSPVLLVTVAQPDGRLRSWPSAAPGARGCRPRRSLERHLRAGHPVEHLNRQHGERRPEAVGRERDDGRARRW